MKKLFALSILIPYFSLATAQDITSNAILHVERSDQSSFAIIRQIISLEEPSQESSCLSRTYIAIKKCEYHQSLELFDNCQYYTARPQDLQRTPIKFNLSKIKNKLYLNLEVTTDFINKLNLGDYRNHILKYYRSRGSTPVFYCTDKLLDSPYFAERIDLLKSMQNRSNIFSTSIFIADFLAMGFLRTPISLFAKAATTSVNILKGTWKTTRILKNRKWSRMGNLFFQTSAVTEGLLIDLEQVIRVSGLIESWYRMSEFYSIEEELVSNKTLIQEQSREIENIQDYPEKLYEVLLDNSLSHFFTTIAWHENVEWVRNWTISPAATKEEVIEFYE